MAKTRLGIGVAFAAVVTLKGGLAQAQSQLPYLYQQLGKPTYRHALDAALTAHPSLPAWFRRYLRVHDGVDVPGRPVVADGSVAEAYSVCEPHRCGGDSEIHVIFAPGGGRAWLLLIDGNQRRYFGEPSSAMQAALLLTSNP